MPTSAELRITSNAYIEAKAQGALGRKKNVYASKLGFAAGPTYAPWRQANCERRRQLIRDLQEEAMSTYLERIVLVGVGVWLGTALSRTSFDMAAVPLYIAASILILLARLMVDRRREKKSRLS